jgi:hypothetical protein
MPFAEPETEPESETESETEPEPEPEPETCRQSLGDCPAEHAATDGHSDLRARRGQSIRRNRLATSEYAGSLLND